MLRHNHGGSTEETEQSSPSIPPIERFTLVSTPDVSPGENFAHCGKGEKCDEENGSYSLRSLHDDETKREEAEDRAEPSEECRKATQDAEISFPRVHAMSPKL